MDGKTIRLPALATLQAFEAAVRHASYTRAANELHLTHGAISRHIATLEQRTGVRLFLRQGQSMQPTPAAHLLVQQVRQSLALLERSFTPPQRHAERQRVTLSVLPAFASRWLVPRLADFVSLHPDLDLTIDVRTAIADFEAGDADCAVRLGAGGWKNVQQRELFADEQFPVCAPTFRGGDLPHDPHELIRCTLLGNPWLPWEPWLDAAGIDHPQPRQRLEFTDSIVLLDAAVAGLGIAMGRGSLVEHDLAAGRLVRLGRISIRDPYTYWFVWPAKHPRAAALSRVGDWLAEQVREANRPVGAIVDSPTPLAGRHS